MKPIFRYGILLLIQANLVACSSFYPPWNSPRDYPVNYNDLSTDHPRVMTMTDELRSVIIVPKAGKDSDLRVCPEPPADAAENIANSFKAELQAAQENPTGKTSAETSAAKISSSDLASILNRSQGLELFRDGSNVLCLAWLNDIYNNGDLNSWRDDFRYLLLISSQLIDKEITTNNFTPPKK